MLPLLVLFIAGVSAQFEVPDALVEPLSPKGFRVSIPGEWELGFCGGRRVGVRTMKRWFIDHKQHSRSARSVGNITK